MMPTCSPRTRWGEGRHRVVRRAKGQSEGCAGKLTQSQFVPAQAQFRIVFGCQPGQGSGVVQSLLKSASELSLAGKL
jgi:hypothetical protein